MKGYMEMTILEEGKQVGKQFIKNATIHPDATVMLILLFFIVCFRKFNLKLQVERLQRVANTDKKIPDSLE